MKVIGLTGNIGCGKSTVAGMLRERGVAIVEADAVARQLRTNDDRVRRQIEERFGTVDAYVAGLGVGPAVLEGLRAALLEPAG